MFLFSSHDFWFLKSYLIIFLISYNFDMFMHNAFYKVNFKWYLHFQALRLSKKALGESTIGQMVNLLSNDVSRFDFSTIFIHYLWCGPLQFLIIMYLTWLRWGFIYTFWFSLWSTRSTLIESSFCHSAELFISILFHYHLDIGFYLP